MKNIITKLIFSGGLLFLVSCTQFIGDKYEGIWVKEKCFLHKQNGLPSKNCPLERIVIKKDVNNYIIKKQDYQIKFWNTNRKDFYELRENKLVNIDYPSSFDNYQLGKDNTLETYNGIGEELSYGIKIVYHKID
jgi:hypothetical protein